MVIKLEFLQMINYMPGNKMSKLEKILSSHVYPPLHSHLHTSPYNYFEIGVFNGRGFAEVAANFPNKKCVAVDPFIEDGHTTANSLVEKNNEIISQRESFLSHINGLINVEYSIMTSHAFKDQLTQETIDRLKIGTVLIDGNHFYEYVANDYELAMQLIDNRAGFIVFDDTDQPGVLQALEEFKIKYANRIESVNKLHGECHGVSIKAL
jgi:Methyltransferase domain